MNIALIAGGTDEIPSKKFGAIEMVLWNYKRDLEHMGHSVTLFNTRNLKTVADEINKGTFDFVELNYSEYVGYFLRHLRVPFCTVCHSGYITNQKKWSIGYYSVFYDMMRSPGIIALSEAIKNLYIENGYKGFIRVVRNGIDVGNFSVKERGNGRALCLGRIEPRKRQTWLANILKDNVDIDFIGPIQDETFKAQGRCQYKGYWMKHEVYEHLSDYSCLVLLSDGEAAPLVVPEALAAGLSIVVSRSAAANLDLSLPFISVTPDELTDPVPIAYAINHQIALNSIYRSNILSYAKNHFDSAVVASVFLDAAQAFHRELDNAHPCSYHIPLRKLPVYLLSRCALMVKKYALRR